MVRLTAFLKAKIIVLWEQEQSIKKIARDLCVTRNTVRRWIRRYQATGDVECDRQGPRPITYTDQTERHRHIVEAHLVTPFKTTRSSAETFGVSLSTVRRHLHAANIHNYKPARKIRLTDDHRTNRINFAIRYLNFDWDNEIVIFTDEKCFKSDKDGRKILWRRSGQRFDPKNILDLRTSGRITLGYWGWMSSMGPGELVEIGGRMNSERYVEVLKDVMLSSVRVAYPEGQIYLVQDNSSVYRSRIVQDWLKTQEDITVFEWPAKSPDLNPIENLWGQMVLNWDSSEIKSKKQLDAEVNQTWELMRNSAACSNMVSGMKRRLQEVIDNDGHPLRY